MTQRRPGAGRRPSRWAPLGLALVALAQPLHAQATVPARLTIPSPGVTGAGVRPVEFGTVFPGGAREILLTAAVDSTAPGAGAVRFRGVTGSRDVQLDLAWSVALLHADGSSIPVSMNGSFGLHCFDRKPGQGLPVCTLVNPAPGGGTSAVLVARPPAPPGGNTGELRLYLGGRIDVGTDVSPGLYTGQISIALSRL